MAITNLQEKQNKKFYVPIRPGNRGGWALFNWQSVRQMPYRDREMYLGNSAKIGILDKGGKWRKKDWYLKKHTFQEGEKLSNQQREAMSKDQQRIKTALGLTHDEDQEQLTQAEMELLLKKLKGKKEDQIMFTKPDHAIGLGFDKTKVEIRAQPTAYLENPHRLEGNIQQFEKRQKKEHKTEKDPENKEKRQKKKQKKKHKDRSRSRSRSHQKKKKDKKRHRDSSNDK